MVLVGALSYATVAQGAFYAHQFRVLVALVGLALVLSLATGARTGRARGPHPLALTLAALAVVALASAGAAGRLRPALPTLGLLAVLLAALVVVRRAPAGDGEVVVSAVVVLGVITAAAGVAGVALRREPLALLDQGLWRSASTLTYANATAGLLLVPALVALGRSLGPARPLAWRLAGFALVLGVMATLSRGGVAALAAGLAALVLLGGGRAAAGALMLPVAAAAVALVGLLPSMPDRLPPRPLLAAAAVAAGAAVVVAGHRRRRPAVVSVLAAVAVMAALGAAAAGAAGLDLGPDVVSVRGTVASPDRLDGWGAALEVARRHPVLGAGPGNVSYRYVNDAGEPRTLTFVHNEYLQLGAELGLAGIVVLTAGLALTARRLRRPPPTVAGGTWAGAVAGLAALGLHSALDFLWHVPVVVLVATVVAGAVSAPGSGVGAAVAVDGRPPPRATRGCPRLLAGRPASPRTER